MLPNHSTALIKTFLLVSLFLLLHIVSFGQASEEVYPVDSASVEHAGVPKGEIIKLTLANSKIFPGTWREYWVYVPAQYRSDKPACVYVNQDGIQFKAPTVFDNLIHSKEMPITVGVFISPGAVRATNPAAALDRYNRSFEYDGLGDAYARFVLQEILPEVEKLKTSDGRTIHLSQDANDRAIGGSSSGAICAFTAAWERPDAFSRVFSSIGTYVGLRGGDRSHTMIRKVEPKAIRVFLQDGSNDNNIYAGDWWKANETMDRALAFAGYDVQHTWGEGAHNGRHATAIFPQAMRWLWKDYPTPVKAGKSKNQFLSDLLIPSEGWELVGEGYGVIGGLAVNPSGDIFFHDALQKKNYTIPAGGKSPVFIAGYRNAGPRYFDAEGNQFMTTGSTAKLVSVNPKGNVKIIAGNVTGDDMIAAGNGHVYTLSGTGTGSANTINLVRAGGEKVVVDKGIHFAKGLTLSPDQTQLYVTESASHWIYVFQVQPDGGLLFKQKYGWLHVPDSADNAGANGLQCDTSGRVYVATSLGIQVLDQTGRVNAILSVPSGQPTDLCFGGKQFDTLYISCGNKLYRRKLHTRGANSFEDPIKPVKPRL